MPKLTALPGLPCDAQGNFLPEGAPPWDHPAPDDFSPFQNQAAFKLTDLLFCKEQMSARNINELLEIWASTLPSDQDPLFINKQDLYNTTDSIKVGDVPW